MDSIIFLAFALAYLVLTVFLWKGHKKLHLSSVLFLVLFALVYDNFIIGIGRFIGEGMLLEVLNFARFWLHALFTPTLIIFSIAILQEAGIAWAKSKMAVILAGILFLLAIVLEYITELNGLAIAPNKEYGALSYSSVAEATGPPLMILVVLAALLVAAVTLAWRFKWWWMLIGVIFMTIGSAVPINVSSNAITNLFELFLLFTLILTKKHFTEKTLLPSIRLQRF